MGDNDYRRYCEHLRRQHPGVSPISEREYWKARWAREGASPQGRCC
ncbi:hypothetical protein C3E79_04775 [Corynebacterium liangguodongii]|uniref:Uncharacterized protein n=2 Tax=Corynebacterium liangguodongii TaxID=2079535 RepID=A0A2S0WH12_9CORY|nr:hypothetical protein C3E79_04775 [Corynebacterium liangguodongii]PWB99103.1 DUF466 domain-containing protein [Corynebacterium liangguodongii]